MPNDSHHCGEDPQKIVASVLPPIMIIELILGLPGNIVALWIFCCRLNCWRPTVLLLFNLVVADFLLLVSVPFRIDNLLRGENWVFGDAWCRINLFMLAVNRSASIGFMTAVAVDRYFKVVHPHHGVNSITVKQMAGVAVFIWAAVILLRLPLLTNNLLSVRNNTNLCRSFNSYEDPPPGIKLHYMLYLAEFFLPLLLLVFCSARIACILRSRQMDKEKKVRRAIRTVLVIVGVFVLCFLPGIATGLASLSIKKFAPENCKAFRLSSQFFSLSIGFTYLNSVLDPVIYCFSSSMFRNALRGCVNRLGLVDLQLSRRGSTVSDS
ncbi:hydroxycarboxylic acid receptor 2 [Chanos chanos]|uniref:Hydroxycarboxylic acid receptor 2 n=1 Tax=Chanos chanos TaxID=29144 RepID=A0A6J2VAN4_CHACN|nr:hydroxycarboxylic acid receptor 2-like [Chanos chanos]